MPGTWWRRLVSRWSHATAPQHRPDSCSGVAGPRPSTSLPLVCQPTRLRNSRRPLDPLGLSKPGSGRGEDCAVLGHMVARAVSQNSTKVVLFCDSVPLDEWCYLKKFTYICEGFCEPDCRSGLGSFLGYIVCSHAGGTLHIWRRHHASPGNRASEPAPSLPSCCSAHAHRATCVADQVGNASGPACRVFDADVSVRRFMCRRFCIREYAICGRTGSPSLLEPVHGPVLGSIFFAICSV